MHEKTMAAALATLACAAFGIACDKTTSPATEMPASTEPDAAPARTFEIAPGKFAEANFEMAKGSKVTIAFSKGSPEVAWDIHSHDHSGGTKIHDQGKGGDGTVEFVAPSDGVFSVLWKNTGSSATPLEARVTLGEGAQIHSWMPAD